jgi:choline dehydrogenase-like flavoprotein
VIVDGGSIPARDTLTADVCVVGAGAAGITLALALADLKISVLVLESGGFEPQDVTQDLARGESVGLPYPLLETTRLRCLGGSTMHWGGWCRPLEPIDFDHRPWVPYSGWPITRAALDPYYLSAQQICQLGSFDYSPGAWELPEGALLSLSGDRVRSQLIQFSPPTRFGIRYREALALSQRVTVYLNTTAVQLRTDENGRTILGLHAATLADNSFKVVAKRYVVAAGGIDNPRLLLASNEVVQAGIGNDNDLVGRFFSEHMQLDTAALLPIDSRVDLGLYQPTSRQILRRPKHAGRSANVMAYLTLDRKVQESRRTLNYSANVLETTWSEYFLGQDAADGSRSAWQGFVQSLSRIWNDIGTATRAPLGSHDSGARIYKIVTTQEQAPNPLSRIRLSSERDAFGMPRVLLDWRLTDLDRDTIEVAVDEFVKAFGANSTGKVHAPLELRSRGWPTSIPISWHHCGTTRMSEDPKQGVVNGHGRVHGVDNLYVAGSSVFPTNGSGNPTLTIVALALRLADHLKETIR